MKNTENLFIEESNNYDSNYENSNVKFARIIFAEETDYTILENQNFDTKNKKASWVNATSKEKYLGIVDANPTAKLAEFSNTEISEDGINWFKVRDIVTGN